MYTFNESETDQEKRRERDRIKIHSSRRGSRSLYYSNTVTESHREKTHGQAHRTTYGETVDFKLYVGFTFARSKKSGVRKGRGTKDLAYGGKRVAS